jgi:hypothetical protein
MPNESLTRSEDIVDGRYRIGAVINRSDLSTLYETQVDGDHTAVIKIRERDAEDGDPIGRSRGPMDLAHPNLLKIYAAGSSILNGVPVTWTVMERADESLEGVLRGRPLTVAETREMLVATAAALRYLHEKGYAHSRLYPSNVLAVGEQIKLSSDGLTRMDEGGSAADDMRALGALILQAVHVDGPEEIPQPFRDVAQHCLDPNPARRWTAGQAFTMLTTQAERPPSPGPRVEAKKDTAVEDPSPKAISKWIYVALAALVVAVLLVAGLRKRDPVEHAAIPPDVRVQVQTPPAPTPAPGENSTPATTGASAPAADGWSVIAAAYSSSEPAEKRARGIAKKWPKFNPVVSQSRTGKGLYVVLLGQNLSEDGAEALRKRAVAAGLPRDIYISKK